MYTEVSKDFPVVVAGLITNQGDVLVGKKEKKEGHPISGQWHFPGGHLDKDERVREAVKREIMEETDLDVEIHQLIDVYKGDVGIVRVIFHCEAEKRDAQAKDDLEEVKWVDPENLEEELGEYDSGVVEREEISKFLEKLKKMPSF